MEGSGLLLTLGIVSKFFLQDRQKPHKTPVSLVSVLSRIEATPPTPRTQITSGTMNQAQNIINATCVLEVANVADICCNLFACRHDGWW